MTTNIPKFLRCIVVSCADNGESAKFHCNHCEKILAQGSFMIGIVKKDRDPRSPFFLRSEMSRCRFCLGLVEIPDLFQNVKDAISMVNTIERSKDKVFLHTVEGYIVETDEQPPS